MFQCFLSQESKTDSFGIEHNQNSNNNVPCLYRINFSVKMLLLSTRILLKLKILKLRDQTCERWGKNCKRLNNNRALNLETKCVYFPFKINKGLFISDVT